MAGALSLTEQPRACPSCAAANPPTRELCTRCGVDLEHGTTLPQPVQRDAPDPPTLEPTRRRSVRRWLVPIVGAVLLAVLLVLALTLVGLGPLARGPEVPPAEFDAGRYAGEAEVLVLSGVATRTTSDDADAEAAAAIADGDPTTAWRSDGTAAADRDVLDTIDLVLDEAGWIERIELRNGDQLDREAYDGSARLREVRLRFDGGVTVLVDLLDIGLSAQEIELPEPVLTTVVRIDILRAVDGPNDQLAVSGIELFGWAATGDDVELAEERAEVEPATGPTLPTVPTGLGGAPGSS